MTTAHKIILQNLYEALKAEIKIDNTDWAVITSYASKWKISVAEALLDLNIIEESILARCLAISHSLTYIPATNLKFDFSQVSLENYNDLMNVCAVPIIDSKLAVSNPDDDHRGFLGQKFCEREMVVSERSGIMEALRKYGLEGLDENEN